MTVTVTELPISQVLLQYSCYSVLCFSSMYPFVCIALHRIYPFNTSTNFITRYNLMLLKMCCIRFLKILRKFKFYVLSTRRILLERLTSSLLVKKFPALYGNRRFNTALISAHHLSISSKYQSRSEAFCVNISLRHIFLW